MTNAPKLVSLSNELFSSRACSGVANDLQTSFEYEVRLSGWRIDHMARFWGVRAYLLSDPVALPVILYSSSVRAEVIMCDLVLHWRPPCDLRSRTGSDDTRSSESTGALSIE